MSPLDSRFAFFTRYEGRKGVAWDFFSGASEEPSLRSQTVGYSSRSSRFERLEEGYQLFFLL